MRGIPSSAAGLLTGSGAVPGRPGRRALIVGALAAGGLTLAGCSIRLEDSAPEIPFIPTRDPVPAEPALLWLLADCRSLARAVGASTPDPSGATGSQQAVYEEQVAVLRTALYRAGVPIETLDEVLAGPTPRTTSTSTATAAATPTPSTTAESNPDGPVTSTGGAVSTTDGLDTSTDGPGATSDGTAADSDGAGPISDGPGAALERLPELVQCGGGLYPLVLSILAQRWAAVDLGGGLIPEAAVQADPARLWDLPFLAVPFAQLTDAARYGFQVVAAQSRDATRDLALEGLHHIEALWREQDTRSGGRAPSPAFGYPLPFPVNSEESAAQLATHVISGLIDGYGGLIPTMVGSAQEECAPDLVTWLGTAAAIGTWWGVPLQAFPGTRAPDS